MSTYRTNIRLKNGVTQDYELLDQEMATAFFILQPTERPQKEGGREYRYTGSGSLQEITAAAYRAAHSTGKEYSFTIIRQKGAA